MGVCFTEGAQRLKCFAAARMLINADGRDQHDRTRNEVCFGALA